MNLIDKAVNAISPAWGEKRAEKRVRIEKAQLKRKAIGLANKTLTVENSGYGNGGASHRRPASKRWHADSSSPERDIEENRKTLRERSRDLYMNSPLGAAAINATRTSVVGGGLVPKPKIDYEYLHIPREYAEALETKIKKEFKLWADSTLCDNNDQNNFYELQQIAFADWLKNGEEFCVIRYDSEKPYMPYQLRLKLVEGDRVSTPGSMSGDYTMRKTLPDGNQIVNGVEIDSRGKVVAYHISSFFPGDLTSGKREWTRIEKRGAKTGNANILHIFNAERADQYRGVPFLAPILETLKQMTRYTEAEITAAVIGAIFSVFIQTETGEDIGAYTGDDIEEETPPEPEDDELVLSTGASVHFLKEGESVNAVQATHPTGNFEQFIGAMAIHVGAALEIAPEVLQKKFSASYSAAKGAMTESWKSFRMRRSWFVRDFCQEVYTLWMNEAVAKGRIMAPGYFTDPTIRAAYTACTWTGPAPGALDPGKEVDAAIKRIDAGLSTHEEEAASINGTDFDDNIRTLMRENELMRAINSEEGGNE